ncbi:hypothetical protein W04_1550 [Pseudoalteromonas sp. SW0106-04]|nr:hypothetical protein W04_1550 [Pseudoalteromonas sp. SW0106-04]
MFAWLCHQLDTKRLFTNGNGAVELARSVNRVLHLFKAIQPTSALK